MCTTSARGAKKPHWVYYKKIRCKSILKYNARNSQLTILHFHIIYQIQLYNICMALLFTIFQLSSYCFAIFLVCFFFFSVLQISDISPTAKLLYDQGPIKYEPK